MTPGKAQVPGTETPHESASAGAQPGIHPEGQTTRVAFLGPQGTFTAVSYTHLTLPTNREV